MSDAVIICSWSTRAAMSETAQCMTRLHISLRHRTKPHATLHVCSSEKRAVVWLEVRVLRNEYAYTHDDAFKYNIHLLTGNLQLSLPDRLTAAAKTETNRATAP